MANEIQIFSNPQFGEIRTLAGEANEPMFCAKDVATALGYADTADAIQRHCKSGKKVFHPHANGIGGVNMVFITEKDVYRLIMRSNLPDAEKFQDWVCDEVLPSIRKHGGYIVANEDDTADELMARALIVAQRTLERRDERIRLLEAVNTEQAKAISEMSPKATYYNIILQSPSTVTVTQVAQDYGMSAKAFNKLLHTLGIQRKVGRQWVLYSEYISNGYVQSATEPMKNSHSGRSYTYSRWTQKGRIFLYNELKNRGVLPLIEKAA
jgi:putative antirepressor (bro family)